MEKIKGGLADNKTLEDIAKKHNVSLDVIKAQFDKGVKVEAEHTDSVEQAEEIAKDHLMEASDYYDKLEEVEKTNSKDWAKTFRAANFIEKGVCTYKDETIYLSQETLNKAIQSIKGRPVVIKHQKVTPQNKELQIKLDIVKHVISVKQDQEEAKVAAAARATQRRILQEAIAKKKSEAIDNADLASLEAELAKIDAA